jgi:sulfite reductase beta subunit-like hemoprotein
VKVASLPDLYSRLRAAGLGAAGANTIADVVSCPGAESCRLAVTQSRGLGRTLTEYLDSKPEYVSLIQNGDIKISGCPNGCGQHHIAAIGFQGSVRKVGSQAAPQYFVLVGGGSTESGAQFGRVVSKVPVRRLTAAIDRLLRLYQDRRAPNESLGAFYRRIPATLATDALADLAQLLPGDTTKEDFIDLGETQAFETVVMEGECAS